jgi:hypothetical protein
VRGLRSQQAAHHEYFTVGISRGLDLIVRRAEMAAVARAHAALFSRKQSVNRFLNLMGF